MAVLLAFDPNKHRGASPTFDKKAEAHKIEHMVRLSQDISYLIAESLSELDFIEIASILTIAAGRLAGDHGKKEGTEASFERLLPFLVDLLEKNARR